jgi:hypothetical protein
MRTILLAVMLASAAAGCSKADKADNGHVVSDLPTISVAAVDTGLAANELTTVDCNGEKTRKKFGIVPGAILVEDEELFEASVLPADKTRKLVFYCSGPT